VAPRSRGGLNIADGGRRWVDTSRKRLRPPAVDVSPAQHLQDHGRHGAGPAHVGDEPAHLQGVDVPPFPPVGQPLVEVAGGGESRHDRSGQPFVLAESVGDPLRTGGILEVAGITDQHPSRAGRLPEEHRERRHGVQPADPASAARMGGNGSAPARWYRRAPTRRPTVDCIPSAPPPTAPRGPVRPRRIRPGHRRPVRRAPPALRRGSRSAPGRPRPPLLDQGGIEHRPPYAQGWAGVGRQRRPGGGHGHVLELPSNPSNHGAPDVSTRSSTPSRSRQETPSAWIQWVDGVSEGNRARSPTTTDRPAVGGAWPTTSPRTGRPPR
jgi:hypothetical protein